MVKSNNKLRYIEVSRRNPVTKLLMGNVCGEVCIEIKRAGHYDCEPKVEYNACCQPEPKPLCDLNVTKVCALEVNDDGYAIFEWPSELYSFKEGWYEGYVMVGCNCCAILPLRIGPRCNVLEVETVVSGPDDKCWVGCDEDCEYDLCSTKETSNLTTYVPDYEV